MIFDFLREHRFVRGSISIFLALMLLPMFSFIALMIESARFRSAEQQLNELNFMGQMAILADYLSYIEENYDLYAFDTNGKDMNRSFEDYVNHAKTAGIDTTNMNRLFGIDEDNCKVTCLYSLADPEVLSYQIATYGMFALPGKLVENIKLPDFLKNIQNVFKKINKKLGIAKNAAGAFENSTSMINNLVTLNDGTRTFSLNYGKYIVAREAYESKLTEKLGESWDFSPYWFYLEDPSFYEYVLTMDASSDTQMRINDLRTKSDDISKLMGMMNTYKSNASEYYNETDTSKKDMMKVTLSSSEYNYLYGSSVSQEVEITVKDLISKFNSKYKVLRNSSLSGDLLLNSNDYSNAIEKLDETKKETDSNVQYAEYASDMKEIFDAYGEFRSKANDLKGDYETYCNSLKGFVENIDKTVDNFDEMQALSYEIAIDDLNKDTKTANDIANSPEDYKNSEEHKAAKNQAANERRESYHETRAQEKQYAAVGVNTLEKFSSKVNEIRINKWLQNLKDKFSDDTMPDLNDVYDMQTAQNAKKALTQTFSKTNMDQVYKMPIIKFSAFGSNPPLTNAEFDDLNDEIAVMLLSDGKVTDPQQQLEIDQKIIAMYDSVSQSGNPFDLLADDYGSYYLDTKTVVLLGSFLTMEAVTDKTFFKKILQLLDAFEKIFSHDSFLNSYVKIDDTFPSRSSSHSDNNTLDILNDAIRKKNHIIPQNSVVGYTKRFYVDNYSSSYRSWNYGRGLQKVAESIEGIVYDFKEIIDSAINLRLFKLILKLGDLIGNVKNFIEGVIGTIADLISFIGDFIRSLVTGDPTFMEGFLRQFMIAIYTTDHFKCRQTAETNSLFELSLDYNQRAFKGAQMEYLLIGNESEWRNQDGAYYIIFLIRYVCNLGVIYTSKICKPLIKIPYIGWAIPLAVNIVETKLDMMMMLFGKKIAFIKTGASLDNIDELIDDIQHVVNNLEQNKLTYTYQEGKKGSNTKMRKYSTEKDRINGLSNKAFGVQKDTITKNKDGTISLGFDYQWYLNVLLLLYPEETKLNRMGDLIQMGVREDKNSDTFELSKCYTYIGTDIYAKYDPLFPTFSGGADFAQLPEIESVQFNGY